MAFDATKVHSVEEPSTGLPWARSVPVGGVPGPPGSVPPPVPAVPRTSSSESCPAGQPVLAETLARTYRADVSGTSTVTVFPEAGSNVYAALALRVLYDEPSVLDWSVMVWVRAPQPAGSLSTRSSTVAADPRSTCAHWGNAPFADSQ
ncbi:hypothetical protein D3C74_323690 [compost metagenome]